MSAPLTQSEIDATIESLAAQFDLEPADVRSLCDIAAEVAQANTTTNPPAYFHSYIRQTIVEHDTECRAAADDEERRYGRGDWE